MKLHWQTAVRSASLVVLATLLVCTTGCGSKAPPEANDALDAALSALAKDDTAAFVAAVLPAQREKVVALPQWGSFRATRSHQIDNEFDMEVSDESAQILTTLYFDAEQKVHNNIYFVMKKSDGAWFIDLDETISKQIERNGSDAFEAFEWVTKKE